MNDSKYKLIEAPIEERLKIIEIVAGKDAKQRLYALGIHIGDEIIKLSNTKWRPQLIQNLSNGSSKVAIGRGLSEKIYVTKSQLNEN